MAHNVRDSRQEEPKSSSNDRGEQLAWDFAQEEVQAPKSSDEALDSSAWVASLQPTDEDALRLARVDVAQLSAEVAARLWAKVAAWVEADQIAYYIDDAPVSSDAAYDARLRCLQALESAFPSLDNPQSPTHRVGGSYVTLRA